MLNDETPDFISDLVKVSRNQTTIDNPDDPIEDDDFDGDEWELDEDWNDDQRP